MPMISFRVPDEELEKIDANAAAANLNRSQWMIHASTRAGGGDIARLEQALVKTKRELAALLAQLEQLGSPSRRKH
jgi:uncharacterized protein (DUF1778 family)